MVFQKNTKERCTLALMTCPHSLTHSLTLEICTVSLMTVTMQRSTCSDDLLTVKMYTHCQGAHPLSYLDAALRH